MKNTFRTLLTLVLTFVVLFSTTTISHADVEQAIHIYVENERLVFPTGMGNPFISNEGRTMIPLRAVSEVLGYEVSWNQEAFSAEIKGNGVQVSLPINKNYGFVNGTKTYFDTYTITKDGRSYVPLRFVSETLGMKVDWEFGPDKRANNEIAHIIDLTQKATEVSAENELYLENGVAVSTLFIENNKNIVAIASKYGTLSTEDDKNYNLAVGGNQLFYFAKGSAYQNEADLTIYINSSDIELIYHSYNDAAKSLSAEFLSEIYPESAKIKDLYNKVFTDIESTKKTDQFGTFYSTSKLSGKEFTVNDILVDYNQQSYGLIVIIHK